MAVRKTRRIAFANQKGGPGKSTFSLQTTFFARDRGIPTLVVDFDAQGNTSTRLAQNQSFDGYMNIIDLFGETLPDKPIMQTESGAFLIPSQANDPAVHDLEAIPKELIVYPALHIEEIMERVGAKLAIYDCPPSLGRKLLAALTAATHVVCPVEVAGFAIDGIHGLVDSFVQVQEHLNEDLEIAGFVINKYNSRVSEHRESLQELTKHIGSMILKNKIGMRTALDSANKHGLPVWKIKSSTGRTTAKEFEAVVNELFKKCGVKA